MISKDNSNGAVCRFILRHTARQRLKSGLSIGMALLFALSFGWILSTIKRAEAEINRLYETTKVNAQVYEKDLNNIPAASTGELITKKMADAFRASGFVQNAYFEARYDYMSVVPTGQIDNITPEFWDRRNADFNAIGDAALHPIYAFNNYELFMDETGGHNAINNLSVTRIGEPVEIVFAEGWDSAAFLGYREEYGYGDTIPAIIHEKRLKDFGLEVGDEFYFVTMQDAGTDFRRYHCAVVGLASGYVEYGAIYPTLIPLAALEHMEADRTAYTKADFDLDPSGYRNLDVFRDEAEKITTDNTGLNQLRLVINDGELTQAIEPLEKNISLLKVLYPVTVVVSLLVAAGLGILFMLQSAKEAAVIRVLGGGVNRTRVMIGGGQVVLCALGIALGVCVNAVISQDSAVFLAAMGCAGLYFVASLMGNVVTAVIMSNRKPLTLLQNRE
jgi:hypothetical protein